MKFQDLHGVKNGVNRKDFFQKRSREMHFYNTPTSLPHGYNDVIVSQVRETSRKPDELYEICESICPTGRKIELFGRMNNRRKGWLTIGNQLDGTELHEHELIHSYLKNHQEI